MLGFRAVLAISFVLVFSCRALTAEEWGDLSLRLVYDGEPPPVPAGVPGAFALDDKLVVNPKNNGIANVLFRWSVSSGTKVSVNPTLEAAILPKATLNVLPDKFSPRVQVVHTSQRLRLVNLSGGDVHLKSELFNAKAFPGLMPAGGRLEVRLPEPDSFVHPVFNMLQLRHQSWIFVVDHPYATVSDEDGTIKLSNLPVGKHTFIVWHEIPGYVREAHHGGMPVEWKRGRLTVEIGPKENDLGEFLLKPVVFKK